MRLALPHANCKYISDRFEIPEATPTLLPQRASTSFPTGEGTRGSGPHLWAQTRILSRAWQVVTVVYPQGTFSKIQFQCDITSPVRIPSLHFYLEFAKQNHQAYPQSLNPSDIFPSPLQNPSRRIPNLLESHLREIDVRGTLARYTIN